MISSDNSITSLPDKKLAALFKSGDDRAFNELVFRHIGTIGHIASRFSAGGYEHSDFVQEGLLGLMSACLSYNETENDSFKSYMSLVVERRFISIIRRLSAKKSIPDSATVQYESIGDNIEDKSQSPEELVQCREQLDQLLKQLKSKLSPREYQTLTLFVSGMSYKSISQKLGISEKSVDNALQRARKKCRWALSPAFDNVSLNDEPD